MVDQAKCVLVIPLWKSAAFWPILCPEGQFIPDVIDWLDLPTSRNDYTRCKNLKGLFGNSDLKFKKGDFASYLKFERQLCLEWRHRQLFEL